MRYTSCVFDVDQSVLAKLKPTNICTDSVSLGLFTPLPGLDTRHFGLQHVEGNRRTCFVDGAMRPMLTGI
jgi:hypothetical protein